MSQSPKKWTAQTLCAAIMPLLQKFRDDLKHPKMSMTQVSRAVRDRNQQFFLATGLEGAYPLVASCVKMRLVSGLESVFGNDVIEGITKILASGFLTSTQTNGLDWEGDEIIEGQHLHYLVSEKSGRNWNNNNQKYDSYRQLYEAAQEYKKRNKGKSVQCVAVWLVASGNQFTRGRIGLVKGIPDYLHATRGKYKGMKTSDEIPFVHIQGHYAFEWLTKDPLFLVKLFEAVRLAAKQDGGLVKIEDSLQVLRPQIQKVANLIAKDDGSGEVDLTKLETFIRGSRKRKDASCIWRPGDGDI